MEIYPKEIKKTKSKMTSLPCNIKVFVLCHGLLQLSQLLYSSYFKSSITTIERRFSLNSSSSGIISSLHEVGNTVLIVFVSYFGSRVHRPRIIGIGGLLMSVSAMILTLPHFLSKPYEYSSVLTDVRDICAAQRNTSAPDVCAQGASQRVTETSNLWLPMAIAQLLFGVGSVPVQPFGISYVDDFARPGDSPLYIAILFALSVFGPILGYLLGSVMLRIYVDVGRNTDSMLELTPTDPRWVGAWWMGLLVSSGLLALTSIPYFFFPRAMKENATEAEDDFLDEGPKTPEISFLDIKKFPRLFLRLLFSPLFLLLVLTQCCFSSVIAALATFLNKFLERQYSASAAYGSLLMGSMNLPMVAVGMLVGGVIMKRAGLSLKAIPRFSLAMLLVSILMCVPLFFMGCPTQQVAGVNTGYRDQEKPRPTAICNLNCSCPKTAFNPVCGSDGMEYISPCHAGCTNFSTDPQNPRRIQAYSSCSCILDGNAPGSARPGSCSNSCPHLLLPVMVLISLAAFVASLSHNPIYMMVLRTVPQDEKSFAIGVQFMLMRVLAWLPAPAMFGAIIDSSCVWWKRTCGNKLGSCGYYDNDLLRNRYLGLQVGFKAAGIFCLSLVGWKAQRMREYSLTNKLDECL
ncbi:solute carrier organic anion transporter family member 2A1 [Anguilla anguilla]|uniref:solute carrier organic anion transporter family member 2A1 n=1 Tax=Anguilla anguilla TaxID=7936 RepID=UPI0015B1BE0B|nr:solute carrier organic anion transporter family member 2A1 [Anguilla anguilla]XP_035270001.1 solute carrier organic anion transporter family member 2A1 [Anguilla anguilla]